MMLTGVTNNLLSGHQPPWSGVLCCSVSDIKVKAEPNGRCFLRQGSQDPPQVMFTPVLTKQWVAYRHVFLSLLDDDSSRVLEWSLLVDAEG